MFAALAVADKVVGIIQQPVVPAALAYASLLVLLAWASFRGGQPAPRLSRYTALLLLNVLTAAFLFAVRLGADPTPLLLHARLARGDELLERGRKDEAHIVYREAYRQYPRSFTVLMRMGAVSYQVSDFDRARRYYERALELAPPASRWRALNDLGQTYWKLQRPHEAIDLYQQALQSGMPESEITEWHYRMGWASFDARDYAGAIDHYRAVARAGGKYSPASFYNIACAQAQQLAGTQDAVERAILVEEAAANLRQAWESTTSEEEKTALRSGLLGPPGERDPELAPLRDTAPMRRLLGDLARG